MLSRQIEDRGDYKVLSYKPTNSPVISTDYSNMSVAELKLAIDIRNERRSRKDKNFLTKTGNKEMLIKKLEEDV